MNFDKSEFNENIFIIMADGFRDNAFIIYSSIYIGHFEQCNTPVGKN